MKKFKNFLNEVQFEPVFHGSRNSNLSFDEPKQGGVRKAKQQLDFGTHMTQDEAYAKGYANRKKGGRVYKGSLELKSPLDLTGMDGGAGHFDEDHPDFQRALSFVKHLKIHDKSIYHDEGDTKKENPRGVVITPHLLDTVHPKKVHEALVKHDFDGVIYKPYSPVYSSNRVGIHAMTHHPTSYIALHKSSFNLE